MSISGTDNSDNPPDVAPVKEIVQRTRCATDAILTDNLPEIPSLDSATESVLLQWRLLFRTEMLRLRGEVNHFRQFCQAQIELDAFYLRSCRREKSSNGVSKREDITRFSKISRRAEQIQKSEAGNQLLPEGTEIVVLETEEKRLHEKKKNLKEYEAELLEIEGMLNHRQALCDRRQKVLLHLDQELQNLRQELEEVKEHTETKGSIPETNSERARKNWDMVRCNLMDKQHLLEITVHRYRSELAAATSILAGKNLLIGRLQKEATEHEEELARRDRRIKELEGRLAVPGRGARDWPDRLSSRFHKDALSPANLSQGSNGSKDGGISDRKLASSSNVLYRRPSNNAGSEQADGYTSSEHIRNGNIIFRKSKNSISDNAISRLALSVPRKDDKFGRGSSACVAQ